MNQLFSRLILEVHGDWAEWLNNPLRLFDHQLPYRDFWLIFPPGEVYLPFLVYKTFGLQTHLALGLVVVWLMLALIFGFLFSKKVYQSWAWPVLTSLMIYSSGFGLGRYQVGMLHFLPLILSALVFAHTKMFLSGLFLGLGFWLRFYESGALLASCLIVFLKPDLKKEAFLRFLKGLLVPVVVMLIVFWPIKTLLVEQVVFKSVLHGTKMNLPYFVSVSRSYKDMLTEYQNQQYFLAVWKVFKTLNHLAIYLLPFLSAWLFLRHPKPKWLRLVFFWGVFTMPKAMGRSSIEHVNLATLPLYFALPYWFLKTRSRLVKVFVGIFIGLLVFPAGLSFEKLKMPLNCLKTANGRVCATSKSRASAWEKIVKTVDKRTSKDDYVLVTSWSLPPIYALTGRQNPSYYDSFIDLIVQPSSEKQEMVCNNLLERQTKIIIHEPDLMFDSREDFKFLNAVPILQKCFDENFELVKRVGNYDVLERVE